MEMGVSHRYEQAIAGQLFRTDICLLNRPVAVEVDGPSHYLRNRALPRVEVDAATTLKRRRGVAPMLHITS